MHFNIFTFAFLMADQDLSRHTECNTSHSAIDIYKPTLLLLLLEVMHVKHQGTVSPATLKDVNELEKQYYNLDSLSYRRTNGCQNAGGRKPKNVG